MKIAEVEYQQVKSIGQYETCRATVKVVLEDGESADKAFEVAKSCVRRQLGTQEKQKEEDKEKNRQREAMKTKITDGPVYGYPTMATKTGYLTAPEYIEPRQRPTQAHEAMDRDENGRAVMRATTNGPREIVFRATQEGITAEPNQEIRAIPVTDAEWNLTPMQQEIMNQHMRTLARETDRRFMRNVAVANNIGIDIATGGGAGQDAGTIQIDEATQGVGNIPTRQPF